MRWHVPSPGCGVQYTLAAAGWPKGKAVAVMLQSWPQTLSEDLHPRLWLTAFQFAASAPHLKGNVKFQVPASWIYHASILSQAPVPGCQLVVQYNRIHGIWSCASTQQGQDARGGTHGLEAECWVCVNMERLEAWQLVNSLQKDELSISRHLQWAKKMSFLFTVGSLSTGSTSVEPINCRLKIFRRKLASVLNMCRLLFLPVDIP